MLLDNLWQARDGVWEFLFGPDIFISFTRRDGEHYARALAGLLRRRYLVFLDDASIHGGESIPLRIQRGIRRCRLHIVLLTPEAVDCQRAPWVLKEIELHFLLRRKYSIQTFFFPPNTPQSLPERYSRLAAFKGIVEVSGALAGDSNSIDALLQAGKGSSRSQALQEHSQRVDVLREVNMAFSSIRQRVWMKLAFVATALIAITTSIAYYWSLTVTKERLIAMGLAEAAERDHRYLDSSNLWLSAARALPRGRAAILQRANEARRLCAIVPEAVMSLPAGWQCTALWGTKGDWSIFAVNREAKPDGKVKMAFADSKGWKAHLHDVDELDPEVLVSLEAAYVCADGRITRIDSFEAEEPGFN